jgi:rhamnogalacturonyl hydrolase YesR
MVGTHGLYKAYSATGNKEYLDYFIDSTTILAQYYDYAKYDAGLFGQASFLELATRLDNLDAIGSMGRNLCELYKISPRDDVSDLIDILADAAMKDIPRFEDGTYHRERDMWADDLFMSCPFLVRYAALKGDGNFAKEVVNQLLGFKKRLWMAKEQIMSHIFFLDTNEPNLVPWGRGNGWVYVSLTDALEQLPRDTEGYDELMKFYLDFTEGIVKLQDADGLWHQVLTLPHSYQETSCTGMFLLGLCRGINNGWIGGEYKKYADKAYLGLLEKKISSVGNVYDVCMGSSNSKNAEYYVNLGAVDNDDHGTGVILTALNEYIKANEK